MLTKYNKKGKIKNKVFGGVHLKKEFARKVSDIEKFYISLAECGINTTIRCLIKTDKRPPAEIIVAAAKSALRNCKGINLKYKRGKWFFSDKIPEYISYRAYCDNVSDSPVSFLNYREYTLRVSEIHHIKTDTYYISVECFHGACDGMSLLNFVYELFAAMDDKKTERFCCNLTDWDIVKGNFVKNGEKLPLKPLCAAKESFDTKFDLPGSFWATPKFSSWNTSGKISYAISQCFLSPAIVMIPVDIRKYCEFNEYPIGNLALPVILDCGGKSKDDISCEIMEKLKNKAPLSKNMAKNPILRITPSFLLNFAVYKYLNYLEKSKDHVFCALVSHLGKIDSKRLENRYFEATDIVFQLECMPFFAFSVVSAEFNKKLNVICCYDKGRVSPKTVEMLYENFNKYLD